MRVAIREGLDLASALEGGGGQHHLHHAHRGGRRARSTFSAETMTRYFSRYVRELASIERRPPRPGPHAREGSDFNMTALAARGSRFQNGVSRIHGDVSAMILADLWPEVPEQENPVLYVTNGVHVPSFLAPEWADAFDKFHRQRLAPAHGRSRPCSTRSWTCPTTCSGASAST
jgi:starch phosphorylase